MLNRQRKELQNESRRRLFLIGSVNLALFSVLGLRLFHLQILRGGLYKDLSEENRISWRPVSAPRGRIFDRFNTILVDNRPNYRLVIIPELTDHLPDLLTHLGQFLDIPEEKQIKLLKEARHQRAFLPLTIQEHLTWDEVSRIEVRIHHFSGTSIQARTQRHYPRGATAAHLLGYMGVVDKRDKQHFQDLRIRPGDWIGKSGIERRFEVQLRGEEGLKEMEVNAFGREVREIRMTAPEPGQSIHLTLNSALQMEAESAMAGLAGSVVVMDPRSGELLVMVSQPSYDPNLFIRGISSKQWRDLLNDSRRPIVNKTIKGQYPPGSTFKIIVAIAGLKQGIISSQTRHYCSGFLQRGKRRFHCWKRYGHGWMTLTDALTQSCDVYFYHVAEKLGINAIERQARALGLGDPTGIDLPGEQPGLIPSTEWKRARLGISWYPGETLIAAIGQGYVLTTPLQLAVMISTIANGGTVYRPQFIRQSPPKIQRHARLNQDHLTLVKQGLESVVHGDRGTARKAAPSHVRAAGKTGTSQVIRIKRDKRGKALEEKQEKYKDHALFVAYAPAKDPELAIAVIVEHGGHGGSAAAPIAQRIINRHFMRSNTTKSESTA